MNTHAMIDLEKFPALATETCDDDDVTTQNKVLMSIVIVTVQEILREYEVRGIGLKINAAIREAQELELEVALSGYESFQAGLSPVPINIGFHWAYYTGVWIGVERVVDHNQEMYEEIMITLDHTSDEMKSNIADLITQGFTKKEREPSQNNVRQFHR